MLHIHSPLLLFLYYTTNQAPVLIKINMKAVYKYVLMYLNISFFRSGSL